MSIVQNLILSSGKELLLNDIRMYFFGKNKLVFQAHDHSISIYYIMNECSQKENATASHCFVIFELVQ